jgi:4'-phosphopantetheinyl transferase
MSNLPSLATYRHFSLVVRIRLPVASYAIKEITGFYAKQLKESLKEHRGMLSSSNEFSETTCPWNPPPKPILLENNEVHVWFARVDDPNLSSRLEDQLSLEERERASRFKFEKDRLQYTVSHGLLRSILSLYLHTDPKDLQLISGPNGKPNLDPIHHTTIVQFNISHSNAVALFAVAREREVGVDVEYVQENFAFAEIAPRFFSPKETEFLHFLPTELAREVFFRLWTCKEAFVKARGTGLGSPLDEFEISLPSGKRAVLTHREPNYSLIELTPTPGYVAAVAVKGHHFQLKCWQWSADSSSPPPR